MGGGVRQGLKKRATEGKMCVTICICILDKGSVTRYVVFSSLLLCYVPLSSHHLPA